MGEGDELDMRDRVTGCEHDAYALHLRLPFFGLKPAPCAALHSFAVRTFAHLGLRLFVYFVDLVRL
jgi:hypothetical protein